MVEALVNNYWISPTALYIQRNAMGKPDYIQANVVAGATILCYIAGVDGLGYDAGHNYQSWQLSIAPTVFNTTSEKYVYVKIPKPNTPGATSRIAQFAFPSERLDLYGQNENGDQIGSTDYFYIFTQGILSASVDGNGVQQDRVWLQELQTGTLSSDEARSAESDWYSYNRVTEVVSFLKGINMSNANATFHNLAIGQGNSRHVLTGVAKANTPETSDVDIVTPSYLSDKYLSKTKPDTAEEIITFLKGICFGAAQHWKIDGDGNAILNNINAQKAIFDTLIAQNAHFFNLIIDEIKSVGGQVLITDANCRIDYIKEIYEGGVLTGWKCYFKAKEDERTIDNQWDVSDQAIHVEFNVSEGGSKNYWRLVTSKSTNPVKMNITTGVEYGDSEEGEDIYSFHWIVLSKNDCKSNSTIPMVGDEVSQLGNRDSEKTERQNAIILSAYNIPFIYTGSYEGDANGILAPLYASFYNINDFKITEDNLMVGIARNGHVFKGRVVIKEGSTLADGRDINDLGITEGNLVRNSGFTGNFDSEEVGENDEVSADTIIFSDPLKFWESKNVEVKSVDDTTISNDYKDRIGKSVSGSVAIINNGWLKQTIESGISIDTWYVLSFKACCPDTTETTLNVALGGVTNAIKVYNSVQRIDLPFKSAHDGNVSEFGTLVFQATSKVMLMDVMLVQGNIPSEYQKSEKDNDKSLAKYLELSYLQNAMTEASTEIIGGLVLTQLVKVGMYRDKQFTQETGGMSGLYIDEHSPFVYGGGTLEQAIYTAMKYSNPRYMPDDSEVAEMAKFVVTHGGRAILNDICLRGYIYALGGIFKNVQSQDGKWSLDEKGVMKCIEAWISGSIYTPYLIIDNENIDDYATLGTTSFRYKEGLSVITQSSYVLDLEKSGFNLQVDYNTSIGNIAHLWIELPNDSKYVGAEVNVYQNSASGCVVRGVTTLDDGLTYGRHNIVLEKGQKIKLKCINDNNNYRWIPECHTDLMKFREPLLLAQVIVIVSPDGQGGVDFYELNPSYQSSVAFTYTRIEQGKYRVTLPSDWEYSLAALTIVPHSHGEEINSNSKVSASILSYDYATYSFVVGVTNLISYTDGDFGFSIYMSRTRQYYEVENE